MQSLRQGIADNVRSLVGSREAAAGFVRPPGDRGLIGPDSAAWKVHGDFSTMMIGGAAALLLQMLHPSALAGVWDHSNFRKDSLGRLRRTAQFIAGTTFGSTGHAEELITRVRTIHDRVHGELPDGTPYSANDPAVLTFVQVAGADSFLRAYIRYRDPLFSRRDQDRYFAETAVVARRLGAAEVPETRRDADAYLRAVRPQLKADARSREVVQALLSQPMPNAAGTPVSRVMMQAGIDLLPEWASRMHGLGLPPHRKPVVRAGALGIGAVLRWALSAPRPAAP